MASPLISFLANLGSRRVVSTIAPERTLDEVVLPPHTRRALDQALAQVRNQHLIFSRWGLGERHTSGCGLAFNFAGPPGTGKTICAEAIAHALGKKLLVVDYAEAESMWLGETPKNIVAAFRASADQNAVLLFDEADGIAMRRSAGAGLAADRERNLTVNVLLKELEMFNGIVIFATNLAANFDRAFERRIRTHVLFEVPGVEERARIWQLQIHPKNTPLAPDVDFRSLAERYVATGGDIKNAVIKAAAAAAAESGADLGKQISQNHFESAIQDVLAAKSIMQQSLFAEESASASDPVGIWRTPAARSRAVMAVTFGLACAALLVAMAALAVALLH